MRNSTLRVCLLVEDGLDLIDLDDLSLSGEPRPPETGVCISTGAGAVSPKGNGGTPTPGGTGHEGGAAADDDAT